MAAGGEGVHPEGEVSPHAGRKSPHAPIEKTRARFFPREVRFCCPWRYPGSHHGHVGHTPRGLQRLSKPITNQLPGREGRGCRGGAAGGHRGHTAPTTDRAEAGAIDHGKPAPYRKTSATPGAIFWAHKGSNSDPLREPIRTRPAGAPQETLEAARHLRLVDTLGTPWENLGPGAALVPPGISRNRDLTARRLGSILGT